MLISWSKPIDPSTSVSDCQHLLSLDSPKDQDLLPSETVHIIGDSPQMLQEDRGVVYRKLNEMLR